MRKLELLCAGAFLVLTAVVIADSVRIGFGWEKWGPQAGFLPFWVAIVMVFCGGVIFIQGLFMKVQGSFFMSRPAMWAMTWVFLTTSLFVLMILYLGIYIATAVFAALFSAWLGRYPWYVVLAFAIITPIVVFYGMEKGLMIPLPKSPFYDIGWLPF